MIKPETLGMYTSAKVEPTLTATADVKNYDFITANGNVYLIANDIAGDDAGYDDVTIKKGEYLNGYLLKAWDGQKLIIDEKHIAYGEGKSYSDLAVNGLLTINANGKLASATAAPASGVYFKITGKCHLTGKAVKAEVIVVDKDTTT